MTLQRLNSGDLEIWAFPLALGQPGTAGALVKAVGVPSAGNSTLVYFACEDCAVEAARVAEAGGKIERSKTSIGEYGFVAIAVDTEGNRFGLHSMQ